MRTLRSRYRLVKKGPDRLVMSTSPARTAFYLVLFILFLVTFVLNFDPVKHLEGRELYRTLFFLLILLTLLLIAVLSRVFDFDKKKGLVSVRTGILGIVYFPAAKCLPIKELTGIVLRQITLHGHSDERQTKITRLYRDTLRIRSSLYKLILENEEKNLLLEQSTSPDDLEDVGKKIAELLEIPFRTQDV